MGNHHWAYFCWPGLRPLWTQGAVSGFLLAFGAGLLLNLLLLATFVYSEMLTPQVRGYGWIALAVVWVGSAVGSYGWNRWRHVRRQQFDQNDLLATATVEYLKGNWYQAELPLWRLLKIDRRDVDALLMLAAICRHTNRLEEATRQLDELELLERAQKWTAEIALERKLIARKQSRLAEETNNNIEASEHQLSPDEPTHQAERMDDAAATGEQKSHNNVDKTSLRAA